MLFTVNVLLFHNWLSSKTVSHLSSLRKALNIYTHRGYVGLKVFVPCGGACNVLEDVINQGLQKHAQTVLRASASGLCHTCGAAIA